MSECFAFDDVSGRYLSVDKKWVWTGHAWEPNPHAPALAAVEDPDASPTPPTGRPRAIVADDPRYALLETSQARGLRDDIEKAAARVLNALAGALLMAAAAALAMMWLGYVASNSSPQLREWPAGIAGWLVVVPALAAALSLVTAALFLRNPVDTDD